LLVLSAGDECDDDVCGVTVEIFAAPVVDRGRAWVGVTCSELDIAERDTGVEHVRMNGSDTGPPADGSDPSVGGATFESLSVAAEQDWSAGSFSDCEIEGAAGAGNDGDDGGLVAFPDDS